MEQSTRFGLYGTPPLGLVAAPRYAIQFSPLMPGSRSIEAVDTEQLEGFILAAPPGTAERQYLLAQMLRTLSPEAPFTVLAPRDKGGARLEKELTAFGCSVTEEARKHYRIVTGVRPATMQGLETAIASGGPQLVEATGLWSQPGVFSWDRLDSGTALLLAHVPPLTGHGADLGCGIGTLAKAVLAQPSVTALDLFDLDRRALDMATRNLTDARARFHWADLRARPDVAPLDFVVMNPPFHDGGVEDKSLGQQFVVTAAALLRPGGQCYLVANRHLPYEALLKQHFKQTTALAEAAGYKLYKAEK